MSWYYQVLDIAALIYCGLMFRFCIYRGKFFLQVFQQNGYKHNEYWQWLKDHWDAKVITPALSMINILIFICLFFDDWVFSTFTNSALTVIFFAYSFYWFSSVKSYKAEKEKKPLVFTPRIIRLTVPLAAISVIFPGFFSYMSFTGLIPFYEVPIPTYFTGLQRFDLILLIFGWSFGAVLIPFFIFLASFMTRPVEYYIQEGFKKQARNKIKSMPDLKVVAITGSYGKTSTKFMLKELLKERFQVCYTPGSYNTPMGICKVINNDLQARHQILILEMGARYKENIRELCEIARPNISIVTNVGVAHLETFGTRDVIAREKGTLVDVLKEGEVAVLNAENDKTSQMGKDRKEIKRIMVGLETGDIQARDIKYDTSGMTMTVVEGEQMEEISTPLLGAHNAQNLLLAIGVARHLGMRLKTIALAAKDIEPIEHRLELKKRGEVTVIDDAFNSNPVGAKNAVEILSQFKTGKRIIITPGMIELGDIEEQENRKFGVEIGKANLDHIYLVGQERTKPILEGIKSVEGQEEKVKIVKSLFEANEEVFSFAKEGDVVLYENDLPDVYNE